jgi:hypothetical protein
MNKNFNQKERDIVKLASFFKKESLRLMAAGRLGEETRNVQEAVDSFLNHIEHHANTRAFLNEQREYLNHLVKDNAACPKCQSKDKLKVIGAEKNDKGWKSNRYKCRKCNIEFTWNLPNNPWHMIAYIEDMLAQLQAQNISEGSTDQSAVIAGLNDNLEKLKPVIEAHDKDYIDFRAREDEMERLLHEFKNSLMIEKIKMDTWENRQKHGRN